MLTLVYWPPLPTGGKLRDYQLTVDDMLCLSIALPECLVVLRLFPPSGGKLRDYQLDGLNWMIYSWSRGSNGILAGAWAGRGCC